MKAKRGQVTLFIIIAIVVVAVVIVSIYLYRVRMPREVLGAAAVKDYVADTIEEVCDAGVIAAGLHGGYITPEKSLDTEYGAISYWFYEGELIGPTVTETEKEISRFVYANIKDKINFSYFENLKVEEGNLSVKTEVGERVRIEVTYPLIIKFNLQTVTLEEPYVNQYDIDFPELYETGEGLIKDFNEGNLDAAGLENLELTIMEYDESTIFALIDPSKEIGGYNYTLMFAIK